MSPAAAASPFVLRLTPSSTSRSPEGTMTLCMIVLIAVVVIAVVCWRRWVAPATNKMATVQSPHHSTTALANAASPDVLVVVSAHDAARAAATVQVLTRKAAEPRRLVFAIGQHTSGDPSAFDMNSALEKVGVSSLVRRRVTLLSHSWGRVACWRQAALDLWDDEAFIALIDGDGEYDPTEKWDALLLEQIQPLTCIHAVGLHKPGFLVAHDAHHEIPTLLARPFTFRTVVAQPSIAVGQGGGMTLGPATRIASALKHMADVPCWAGGMVLSSHLYAAGMSFLASTKVCMGLKQDLVVRPLRFQPRRIRQRLDNSGYLRWLGVLEGGQPCGRARMGLPPTFDNEDDDTYAASVRYGGADAVRYRRMIDCGEVEEPTTTF